MKKSDLPFNLIIKPSGSTCNLRCEYCYYLEKQQIVAPNESSRTFMSDELLEHTVRSYIEAQPAGTQEIFFSWQGGEPLLMGLSFFRKAEALQQKYKRSGMKISNALQTNATLLDDEYAKFFKDHGYLIGVSIDGPEDIHDHFRKDARGRGSFREVMRGYELAMKHELDVNTLTTVNGFNASKPGEVYEFLKSIDSKFLQFIPIVIKDEISEDPMTVTGRQWGNFLCSVFSTWVNQDVGRYFVQHFDLFFSRYLGYPSNLCVHAPVCGRALILEHNGNLYSCDHFVDTEHLLGNIKDTDIVKMVDSTRQRQFGQSKSSGLSDACRKCEYLGLCYGGCLRNRIDRMPNGQMQNHLCTGYSMFFNYSRAYFLAMKQAVMQGKTADAYRQYMD